MVVGDPEPYTIFTQQNCQQDKMSVSDQSKKAKFSQGTFAPSDPAITALYQQEWATTANDIRAATPNWKNDCPVQTEKDRQGLEKRMSDLNGPSKYNPAGSTQGGSRKRK